MPGAFSKEQKLRRFLKAKKGCAKEVQREKFGGGRAGAKGGRRSLTRAPGHCAWEGCASLSRGGERHGSTRGRAESAL